MMSWRASRASEILNTANARGDQSGTTRLELLRRAALLADAEGDTETAVSARRAITDSHVWMSSEVDMIVAFIWLLHNAPSDSGDDLWTYKWVVATLAELVCIRSELVEQSLEDLERRYKIEGLSTAAAEQLRLEVAMAMRQRDRLPELFDAWQRNEAGSGSDCAACRRDKRVQYFAAIGDDERVVTESKPFLDGSLRCTDVPLITYPRIILSLWRLRRVGEAEKVFRKGAALLDSSERLPCGLGQYFVYLALSNQFEEGCSLLTTWMRRALLTRNDIVRFDFYRGASLLFRSARDRGTAVVHLTLPPTWDGFEEDGIYDVTRLCDQFEGPAVSLAARFDARHGNSGFKDELEQDGAMLAESL